MIADGTENSNIDEELAASLARPYQFSAVWYRGVHVVQVGAEQFDAMNYNHYLWTSHHMVACEEG